MVLLSNTHLFNSRVLRKPPKATLIIGNIYLVHWGVPLGSEVDTNYLISFSAYLGELLGFPI